MPVLFKCAILLTLGILSFPISKNLNVNQFELLALLGLCLLLSFALRKKNPFPASLLIIFGFVSLAWLRCHDITSRQERKASMITELFNKNHKAYRYAITKFKTKQTYTSAEARLIKIDSYDIARYNIKCELFLKPALDSFSELSYLDTHKAAQAINSPANPGEFDFQKYKSRQNIHHICFLNDSDYRLYHNKRSVKLSAKSILSFRALLRQKLKTTLRNDSSYSVAAAMILGDKSDMDHETMNTFSNTGSIHILAVSGLHVGIIFLIINKLLARILFLHKFPITKALITACGVWLYVFICAAPDSASRAAIMLSAYLLGSSIGRPGSVYNYIGLAACCMLLADVNSIYSLGFQFSFLALMGIIYFHGKLNHLLQSFKPTYRKVTQAFLISFTAQVFVFPLIIHYFNQFTTYFWLSSFVAIPFAYLIIVSGICTLSFQALSIGTLEKISTEVLNILLECLISCLDIIQNLPSSVLKGLYIPEHLIPLIYTALLLLIIFLEYKKYFYFKLFIYVCFLYVSSYITCRKAIRATPVFYAFNHRQCSMASIMYKGTEYILADNCPKKKSKKTKSHIKRQHFIEHKIKDLTNENISLISVNVDCPKSIIGQKIKSLSKKEYRLFYLRGPTDQLLESLQRQRPVCLVVDGVFSDQMKIHLKNVCDQNNISFRDSDRKYVKYNLIYKS